MIWLLYAFLTSLVITDASITTGLVYISYQLFKTKQRAMSFFVALTAILFGLNLIAIFTTMFDY